MSKIELHDTFFKLPISYIDNKEKIQENIVDDLELHSLKDNSNNSLYHYVFNPQTNFGKKNISSWSEYYTTDQEFLKDSQEFYTSFKSSSPEDKIKMFTKIEQTWNDIKSNTGFKEKYNYVDWQLFENLNHSSYFLQMLSIYNLTSPIFSLIMPIILLIVPFFLLKIQRISISLASYVNILKKLFSNHSIGRLFTQFTEVPWDKRVYLIVSVVFYLFQIYQNLLTCVRFHRNMYVIHNNIFLIRDYINGTLNDMKNMLSIAENLPSYSNFCDELKQHVHTLEKYSAQFDTILKYGLSIKKIGGIGHVMKCYYEIYSSQDLHSALTYSFGFNAFQDHVCGLQKLIKEKYVNKCTFSKKRTKLKNAYFAPLTKASPVKNTIKYDKKLIITGPNAAGKTTILKTTIFNIILSQQIGFGFYDKASIMPYDMIHCYLNIPDTSARDSLFQAEARRCKEILDCVIENPNKKHFCIFDELYSGTNPYEAVASAYSFIDCLTEYKNVNFVLTTHYIQLCKLLNNNREICNCHMKIKNLNNKEFEYVYKLQKGISSTKGGLKVLYELNYPDVIIKKAESVLNVL